MRSFPFTFFPGLFTEATFLMRLTTYALTSLLLKSTIENYGITSQSPAIIPMVKNECGKNITAVRIITAVDSWKIDGNLLICGIIALGVMNSR